jgi:hypothetical protein
MKTTMWLVRLRLEIVDVAAVSVLTSGLKESILPISITFETEESCFSIN